MPLIQVRWFGSLVTLTLAVAGCGGADSSRTLAEAPDTGGTDAGQDSPAPDTGQDAPSGDTGVAPDAPGDSFPPDAPMDADGQDATDGSSDAESDAAFDAGPGYLLPPTEGCNPTGDACATTASATGIYASYRKDVFLPSSAYAEPNDDPLQGGRFHIAATAQVSGTVTAVMIDGQNVDSMLVEPQMEWYHVWPTTLAAGEPVWFAFHSRNAHWDTASSGQIEIQTTAGVAVQGAFPVSTTPVPLTYVTTTEDLSTVVIHARNHDATQHVLKSLWVNGHDVMAAGVACIAEPAIAPGASVMWTVPLCEPATLGGAWTVVAEYIGAPSAVGVGRVMKPHFVVEAWSKGSDCAFPGLAGSAYDAHRAAGFDTQYMYWGTSSCGYSGADMANNVAPATPGFSVLVGDDFLHHASPETAITNPSAIAGFLTGDESDGEMYENGEPLAARKAADARRLWSIAPELPVYNGAKTNRNIGAFAGMADIQGIDYYVAACAPHITQWGTHPPLRGAYDYLLNARNNHMPLPTWQYAQGLHSGWNRNILGLEVHIQPDPQEILIQAMSVVAAGGKGIMWFQTDQDEAAYRPQRWEAISDVNWSIRGVRAYLREGDLTGAASVNGNAIVEAIRSRDAIVVPVINLEHTQAPTDVACAAVALESMVPHWVLGDVAPTVRVQVPEDFGVADIFEVHNGAVVAPAANYVIDGREIRFEGLPLNNADPVRLLVLARTDQVRDQVTAAMAH